MPLPRLTAARRMGRMHLLTLTTILVAVALAGQAGAVEGITDSDHDGLSNTFENANGLNPNSKDTNGDGLRDAAEDPDGDGLGNLGEQKFGTDPLDADTDDDGTPDNKEDANGNGIKNGAEQDRRAVPSNLTPTLAKAPKDQPPSYRDGCHSDPFDAQIHPCVYADAHGGKTIAIFGDSHVAQWLPGLIKAGALRGWKVVSITKSACPSVDVQFQEPVFHGAEVSCNTWRSRGEKWLRKHKPDLIVISNSHQYRLTDSHGDRIPASGVEKRWKQGLGTTLDALPGASNVMILGDVPVVTVNVPACLKDHRSNIAACEEPRAKVLDPVHDAGETSVAASHGASFQSLNRLICSYDPCPLVINELLVWRTEGHITATYTKQLAPSIARIVNLALP